MRLPRWRCWAAKFGHAWRGLLRALRTQTSFAVHLAAAIGVILAAICFRVSACEWAALTLAIGLVLTAEVFNSAVESLARGPGRRQHPRLRDALDMAAAAVLVAAATAVGVGICIFGPRLARALWAVSA